MLDFLKGKRKGNCIGSPCKGKAGTGTWYYNGIVSLFIEGERYEQEKTSL